MDGTDGILKLVRLDLQGELKKPLLQYFIFLYT